MNIAYDVIDDVGGETDLHIYDLTEFEVKSILNLLDKLAEFRDEA